jgi:hypothetical protein
MRAASGLIWGSAVGASLWKSTHSALIREVSRPRLLLRFVRTGGGCSD